jgi:O-antigen/teichoic acid export membrane protein
MASTATSSAGRILHNSFWYGLETILETLVFLGTSVAVARYLGPTKLGYFSYINFFVMVVNRTSGTGLSLSTRKYMTEYVALGRPGIARSVYRFTYRYQLTAAIIVVGLGVAGVALFGEHGYRLMASILIVSIIPGVMSVIAAQANLAFEDQSRNTFSALGYIFSYAAVILLTLHFHWDLIGIASASLIGRSVEVVFRSIPLHNRLRAFPSEALPQDLIRSVRRFCLEAIAIQILMTVVWDRSEMIFLRAFSSLEQIAFYSVSFGLANNLLVLPRIFGGATCITLMSEASRAPERIDGIIKSAARYLLLVVFPVHLGAAAITGTAIRLTYGAKYVGAIPVLMIAAILAIPRAFQEIPETLLRVADKQKKLFLWFIVTGVLNIALDWALIPRYGAVGAAWGNGLSQAFGIAAIWTQARRYFRFGMPVATTLRLCLAGSIMGVAAFTIGRAIHGLPGLILAIATAAPLYVLLVKAFHGLEASDRSRLSPLGNRLPGRFRGAYSAVIAFVTPAPTS